MVQTNRVSSLFSGLAYRGNRHFNIIIQYYKVIVTPIKASFEVIILWMQAILNKFLAHHNKL